MERSFSHGEANAMPFKNKQLFRNSRPTPIDKEKIRVKKASDSSKSARRKAYDKLRQTAEPETESGNIYRVISKINYGQFSRVMNNLEGFFLL